MENMRTENELPEEEKAKPPAPDVSAIPVSTRKPILDFPGAISPSATRRNSAACASLSEFAVNTWYTPESSPWVQDKNISILATEGAPELAGAYTSMGLIGISTKKFNNRTPEFLRMVILHERAHLHIQSQVRQYIISHHADIDDFFHGRILPDWCDGDFEIHSSPLYLLLGFINPLREENTRNPDTPFESGFRQASNLSAIDNYLELLRKGLIQVNGKVIMPHDINPRHKNWYTMLAQTPDVPLEQLYENDREGLATAMATFYHFSFALQLQYRAYIGKKYGLDMDLMEEAFCTYIGAAGSDMDEIPHDMDKSQRETAQMILSKNYPPFKALQEVRSHEDLVAFLRKIGAV